MQKKHFNTLGVSNFPWPLAGMHFLQTNKVNWAPLYMVTVNVSFQIKTLACFAQEPKKLHTEVSCQYFPSRVCCMFVLCCQDVAKTVCSGVSVLQNKPILIWLKLFIEKPFSFVCLCFLIGVFPISNFFFMSNCANSVEAQLLRITWINMGFGHIIVQKYKKKETKVRHVERNALLFSTLRTSTMAVRTYIRNSKKTSNMFICINCIPMCLPNYAYYIRVSKWSSSLCAILSLFLHINATRWPCKKNSTWHKPLEKKIREKI